MARAPHNGNGHSLTEGTTAWRLKQLEEGQSNLTHQIATVDNEVRLVGKFNTGRAVEAFGPTIAGVLLLWSFAVAPINSKVGDVDKSLQNSTTKLEERIYRVEQNVPSKDALAEKLDRFNEQIQRLEKDTEEFIRRNEFDLRRDSTSKILNDLENRYSELRRSLNELFPATNTIQEMIDRIKRLEEIRLNHQRSETKPAPAS